MYSALKSLTQIVERFSGTTELSDGARAELSEQATFAASALAPALPRRKTREYLASFADTNLRDAEDRAVANCGEPAERRSCTGHSEETNSMDNRNPGP